MSLTKFMTCTVLKMFDPLTTTLPLNFLIRPLCLFPAWKLNVAFICKHHSCFVHSKSIAYCVISIEHHGNTSEAIGCWKASDDYNLQSIWRLIDKFFSHLRDDKFRDLTKDHTKNTVKLALKFKGYYINPYNMFLKSNQLCHVHNNQSFFDSFGKILQHLPNHWAWTSISHNSKRWTFPACGFTTNVQLLDAEHWMCLGWK